MIVTFINNAWGDSHNLARIHGIESRGILTRIYAYRRSYYPDRTDKEFIDLGFVEPGPTKRIVLYLKAFAKLLFSTIDDDQIFYVFGLDNLFLVNCLKIFRWKQFKIVYEIPDIQDFQLRTDVVGKVITSVERWLIKRTDLVVLTSNAFETGYFNELRHVELNQSIVIENKVHSSGLDENSIPPIRKLEPDQVHGKIVIGYFGLLRCEKTIRFLDRLTRSSEDFYVVMRGVLLKTGHLESMIQENKNISFLGKYVSPDHLKAMYEEIDLCWAAYPFTTSDAPGNWQWARTNRYYESGFHKTPMIVRKDTADAELVELVRIGISIDLFDQENVIEDFKIQVAENRIDWQENIDKTPVAEFAMTNEYDQLQLRFESLLENR